MSIVIVDYGSGNISSVFNSFNYVLKKNKISDKIIVTSKPEEIIKAEKVVLPGQGSFKNCMEGILKISGLKESLEEFTIMKAKPILGICVGMQMFANVGYEEMETRGFGWIPGKVIKIDNQNNYYKLPHIGWNEISIKNKKKLLNGLNDKSHMYFVHSYEFVPNDTSYISAVINYSKEIVCVVEKENIFGTQFHPEKSEKNGIKIIENFIKFKL